MAQRTLKKLQYDGSDVVVEVANRDGSGNVITSTYATKSELTTGLNGKQPNLTAGTGIDITSNTISVKKTTLSVLGGMITGTGLDADSTGKVSLKIAGADQLGGIKAGTGLSIDSQTGVATVTSAAWSGVTNKPFSSVASSDFSVTSDVLYVKDSKFATKEYVGDNFLGIGTTLPATNVIPSVSTANKVLLSTATGGTAAWSSGALSSSTTKPLYLNSSGVLTAAKTYAGGTAVTLNGTSKAESTASFYAPTGAGTSGQVLVSSGGVPTWSSNFYTKAEITSLFNGIKQFEYETVAELPVASANTMYKIYLVAAVNSATNNVKDEFITTRVGEEGSYVYSWEQIGSTVLDLSGYVTLSYAGSNLINLVRVSNSTKIQDLPRACFIKVDNAHAYFLNFDVKGTEAGGTYYGTCVICELGNTNGIAMKVENDISETTTIGSLLSGFSPIATQSYTSTNYLAKSDYKITATDVTLNY